MNITPGRILKTALRIGAAALLFLGIRTGTETARNWYILSHSDEYVREEFTLAETRMETYLSNRANFYSYHMKGSSRSGSYEFEVDSKTYSRHSKGSVFPVYLLPGSTNITLQRRSANVILASDWPGLENLQKNAIVSLLLAVAFLTGAGVLYLFSRLFCPQSASSEID